MDLKTELQKTVAELKQMYKFYRKMHAKDPKAIGRIIMFILLAGALIHSVWK